MPEKLIKYLTIGEFIKARRSHLQLTQRDLLQRLKQQGVDYSISTIGWWENDRTVPPIQDVTFVNALCEALEVRNDVFFAALGMIDPGTLNQKLTPIERRILDAFRRGDFEDMMRIALNNL